MNIPVSERAAAPCRWHIDECSLRRIAGWIDDNGPVEAIEIAVNGRRVVTVSPNAYRKDLEEAGIGDGRRAFDVPLARHLAEAVNVVTVRRGGQVLFSETVLRARSPGADAARPLVPPGAAVRAAASAATRAGPPGLLSGAVRRLPPGPIARGACDFYHVTDLPDGTTTPGQWDLRESADEYLGHVDFAGKRVIEIGPASGFLSFYMERQGARVAAVEPPMADFWDLVPQAAVDLDAARRSFSRHIERIRNSFWHLHALAESKVEFYEADAYHLPPQPHKFDTGVLASVLLHVSSPVRMLESLAGVVAREIIIVERWFPELADQPVCRLVPSATNRAPDTWWEFSPAFFTQYLAVLGFPNTTVTRHRQTYLPANQQWEMFTVVGAR